VNTLPSLLPISTDAEILALIQTLQDTEQRLDRLTAGELDTVAGSDGQLFLMRRSQEHLRLREAEEQAAILNALPASIALLDANGVIQSVNDTWIRFGRDNALADPYSGIGTDYIDLCNNATGAGSREAAQFAAGIRAVLAGQVVRYSLEYPCHSETERRWYLAMVTPLARGLSGGAAVVHLDVTARHEAEEQLQDSEVRFRQMAESIGDVFFLTDLASRCMVYVSPAYEQIWGRSRDSLHADPASWSAAVHPDDRSARQAALDAGMLTGRFEFEYRIIRPDGTLRWIEKRGFPVRDADGKVVRIAGVAKDITDRKMAADRLHQMAHYDPLTGLPNRWFFHDSLTRTLAYATLNAFRVAVLCIDLDNFKTVNDTLGHAIGDELLGQFSDRLVRCVRTRDTVGRLGGDEFALILLIKDGQDGASLVANKIREVLLAPFDLRGNEVFITASIGITIHPVDAEDADTLLKYADTAMYRAKQAGRDTYRFFTPQMNADVQERQSLESALRKAVDNGEFVLLYQPKVLLSTGRICGVEALLRWQRPGHGLVLPGSFVSVLEDSGLVVRLGSWVVASVCRQIALWTRSAVGPVKVAINVSARQFIEGHLEYDVIKALEENGVGGDLLELEITESSLLANTERTIAALAKLKKHGVGISIDDFGTGYSSLAYLRRFPVDKLKIDIAFIQDVISSPDAAAITLAIIAMAHNLKLEVIAEGVETAAQLNFLRRHRCDQIQGFHFSPPLPLPDIESMLLSGKRLPPATIDPGQTIDTLLIVDDEESVLSALRRQLRHENYQVLTASSAAAGFELLALHSVQVVISNQRMAAIDGTEFLGRVHELYPDAFCIILSGHSELNTLIDAVNRGAIYRFFSKPWDGNVLCKSILDAFQHHRLLHDAQLQAQGFRSLVYGEGAGRPAGTGDL